MMLRATVHAYHDLNGPGFPIHPWVRLVHGKHIVPQKRVPVHDAADRVPYELLPHPGTANVQTPLRSSAWGVVPCITSATHWGMKSGFASQHSLLPDISLGQSGLGETSPRPRASNLTPDPGANIVPLQPPHVGSRSHDWAWPSGRERGVHPKSA